MRDWSSRKRRCERARGRAPWVGRRMRMLLGSSVALSAVLLLPLAVHLCLHRVVPAGAVPPLLLPQLLPPQTAFLVSYLLLPHPNVSAEHLPLPPRPLLVTPQLIARAKQIRPIESCAASQVRRSPIPGYRTASSMRTSFSVRVGRKLVQHVHVPSLPAFLATACAPRLLELHALSAWTRRRLLCSCARAWL